MYFIYLAVMIKGTLRVSGQKDFFSASNKFHFYFCMYFFSYGSRSSIRSSSSSSGNNNNNNNNK